VKTEKTVPNIAIAEHTLFKIFWKLSQNGYSNFEALNRNRQSLFLDILCFWCIYCFVPYLHLYRKSPWSPSTLDCSLWWRAVNTFSDTSSLRKWFAKEKPSW